MALGTGRKCSREAVIVIVVDESINYEKIKAGEQSVKRQELLLVKR